MATKFDKVRNEVIEKVSEVLSNEGFEVLETGSQEICLPIVGDEQEEGYLVLTFKVPKGSRDGEAYNGYEMAEEWKRKCEEKAQKVAEALRKKNEKIERDRKAREEKARIKAEKLQKKEE